MPSIRLSTLADLPRLVSIYNQAISSQTATADTFPFTVEARQAWFTAHSADVYPIYVCENENGLVVGYLSISPYRERPAYARTAEVSYYVDYDHHARGIGSALMEHALRDAARIGKKIFIAILLEMNTGSIALLEKFGFEKWGYLPEVVEFENRLCGSIIYGRKV